MGQIKWLARLLDGLRRFHLLYDLVPLKSRPMYFPGDDIFLVGENAAVVKENRAIEHQRLLISSGLKGFRTRRW